VANSSTEARLVGAPAFELPLLLFLLATPRDLAPFLVIPLVGMPEIKNNRSHPLLLLLGRVSLENANWNKGVRKMTDSGGLSWEAQEVFQKMKSFNRLPGTGIPMIQLNMKVGNAKTVKKGIPELKSAGLITDTASSEPTLTDKGYKTPV
jgi:hypothetical protein